MDVPNSASIILSDQNQSCKTVTRVPQSSKQPLVRTVNKPQSIQVQPRCATLRALFVACVLVVAVLAAGPGVAAQQPPTDRGATRYDEKPAPIAGLDINEKLGEKLPLDVPLVDSTGAAVKLGDWFNQGRPVLVMFVYYRCPLACPQLMERYGKTFRAIDGLTIGRDFNVLVVSIDPSDKPDAAATEKAARMINYDRKPEKDVAAGWAFLTSPDAANTRRLADAFGFQYRYVQASSDYAHPSAVFLASPSGVVTRYLYGLETPAQTLRLALVEAGEGKIGTSTDKIMLWCFHFDPRSGAYTFTAWRIMQVGGFLSAVAVAGLLVRMLVHEWRRKFAEQAAGAAAAEVNKLSPGAGTAELAR